MRKFFVSLFFLITIISQAQTPNLVSGPWAGNVQLRTATICAEVAPNVKLVAVQYAKRNIPSTKKTVLYKGALGNDFNPVKIDLNGLEVNTEYEYALLLDGKTIGASFPTRFTTQTLWQFRMPAPDFSFLAGSCAYFNEPKYDRPGKPYGNDSSIFKTMTQVPAAFHIWMGDNWYTREVDFGSAWGLNYRASRDRAHSILQPFMAAMPQYAIWDDHDYGPNDAGKSFILKDESRTIFKNYTANPSYGQDGKGIYSKIGYSDVDILLTDDRYFRSEPGIADSVDGTLNKEKTFFGPQQMEWIQNELLFSNATFKIIVVGSQVLNGMNKFECLRNYPFEYKQLMDFIYDRKIKGIVFFSGDRHHSEVIKLERPGAYTLFDVTISPYTAGVSAVRGDEAGNPNREKNTLVELQNFGKITVLGAQKARKLKVEFVGIKGNTLAEWTVSEKELQ